jgi:hypothetical protein
VQAVSALAELAPVESFPAGEMHQTVAGVLED